MAASKNNASARAEADVVKSDAAPLPTAVVVDPAARADAEEDAFKWVRRALFVGALAIGWLFIGWQNRFYFTAPTVFVCLAYLAVVSTIYALWRTGVTAVAEDTEVDDSTWGRPIGRRGEMEREKRTLLKAIKEAEFDREMGKLSAKDAEEMIAVYRLRAIEVIKEIDKVEAGEAGSVREQIAREVKARLEMESKAGKAKADAQADARKKKAKQPRGGKATAEATDESRAADAQTKADDAADVAAGANPTDFDSTEAATEPAKEASS